MSSLTIAKTKKTRLTIAQKLELDSMLDFGHPTSEVMHTFKIYSRTVRNINHSLPRIKKAISESGPSMGMKNMHNARSSQLKAHLIEVLTLACVNKMPVTQEDLQGRPLMI